MAKEPRSSFHGVAALGFLSGNVIGEVEEDMKRTATRKASRRMKNERATNKEICHGDSNDVHSSSTETTATKLMSSKKASKISTQSFCRSELRCGTKLRTSCLRVLGLANLRHHKTRMSRICSKRGT